MAPANKPYVIVANPGFDDEFVVSEHATYEEACEAKRHDPSSDFDTDVMKRRADDSLTTEF
jgi:hypothetical protein